MSTDNITIYREYEYVINNTEPPHERVAFKEVGKDLVVMNKKIAAFVIDKEIGRLKKELDNLINIQIEILASDGKS